jgi:hypothetical protein
MAGLVPAIHAKTLRQTGKHKRPNHVDARPKAGHDAAESRRFICFFLAAHKRRDVAYDPPLAAAWVAALFFSIMRTA